MSSVSSSISNLKNPNPNNLIIINNNVKKRGRPKGSLKKKLTNIKNAVPDIDQQFRTFKEITEPNKLKNVEVQDSGYGDLKKLLERNGDVKSTFDMENEDPTFDAFKDVETFGQDGSMSKAKLDQENKSIEDKLQSDAQQKVLLDNMEEARQLAMATEELKKIGEIRLKKESAITLRGKLKAKMERDKYIEQRNEMFQNEDRANDAASTIQRAVKVRNAKKELFDAKQNDAASTIQQPVKARLTKKNNAATKIQGAIRSKNAKRELESLRQDEEKRKQYYNDAYEEVKNRNNADIENYRQYQAASKIQQVVKARNTKKNESATKIQQAFKVKKAKNDLITAQNEGKNKKIQTFVENRAAKTIQKFVVNKQLENAMEKLDKTLTDSAKKETKRVSRLSLNKGAKVGSNESNQASATLQAALTRARARNNYVDIVSQAKSLEDRKFKITKSGQIDKRFKGNRTANVIAKNAQKEGLPSLNMMATGNITQRRKNRYNPMK
jgi:hypothetical protein